MNLSEPIMAYNLVELALGGNYLFEVQNIHFDNMFSLVYFLLAIDPRYKLFIFLSCFKRGLAFICHHLCICCAPIPARMLRPCFV